MNDIEKGIGESLGLKFCFNFLNSEYDRVTKALIQSRAIGRIVYTAYDTNDKYTSDKRALYFKDDVEVSKFLEAYNNPKEDIVDLSKCSNEELLNEINKRLNKELLGKC